MKKMVDWNEPACNPSTLIASINEMKIDNEEEVKVLFKFVFGLIACPGPTNWNGGIV